ncbi:MAG: flippase-like domain-containing protein [Actinobacteria bacterium]|nr:flippase-like domain-containing protein [Actinomycetota bacterium]
MENLEEPRKKRFNLKNTITFIIRLVISAALIWFLFIRIKWQELFATFLDVDVVAILLLILFSVLLILASVLKWHSLLKSKGVNVSIARLYGLYVVGYFFNNILPSSVGGDVIRMYELARKTKDQSESVASVFMERYIGMAALILFAAIAFTIEVQRFWGSPIFYLIVLMLLSFMAVLFIFFNKGLHKWFDDRIKIKRLERIKQKANEILESIYHYRANKWIIIYNFFLSIMYNLIAVLNVMAAFWVIKQRVPFYYLLIGVPIVLLISAIPVSLGNWGFNEGAYVYCFTFFGINPAYSLSVGFILRIKSIITGIIGGAIYIFMKRR